MVVEKTNEANQITFHIVITMAHNLRPVKFIPFFLMVNKVKIAPHVLLLLSALDWTHGPNGLNNEKLCCHSSVKFIDLHTSYSCAGFVSWRYCHLLICFSLFFENVKWKFNLLKNGKFCIENCKWQFYAPHIWIKYIILLPIKWKITSSLIISMTRRCTNYYVIRWHR